MGAFSSVTCYEVFDTFDENFDVINGITFKVGLQCAAVDRYDLIGDILFTPRYYPKFSGFNVNPIAARAQPFRGQAPDSAASGQEVNYTGDALVTVIYSTNAHDLYTDSIEPYIDYGTMDYTKFKWGTGLPPLSEQEAPPFINRGCNFIRTRYKLAVVPTAALTLLGYVNQAAVTSSLLGLTFDAETLMYQPQGITQTISTISASGWTVTYKFAYNPNGWNTYWRAATQSYESIYYGNSGSRYIQYPLGDFSLLY